MNRLEAGVTECLEVAREVSPYGYFLSNGIQDVLLHYSEVEGDIRPGQEVEVFLFHDTQDRLAATMKKPLIRYGEIRLLQVADIHPRMGCFLEMGIGRHLLLPFDELPKSAELRPRIDDRVWVLMSRDKQGRMMSVAPKEKDLKQVTSSAPASWMNREIECTVYRTMETGSFVVAGGESGDDFALGMIHASERTRPLRIGETLTARVTFVRPDGRVNLSMRPRKEKGREEHAEAILSFLQGRPNGAMPYSDESPAEIIQEKFGISKAAFKRALGKLMKERAVVQRDGWTFLQQKKDGE